MSPFSYQVAPIFRRVRDAPDLPIRRVVVHDAIQVKYERISKRRMAALPFGVHFI
jgi:hypothetical protein